MASVFLDLLRKDEYIVISKILARSLGLEAALLYSELIEQKRHFEQKHELKDLYWFHVSPEEIQNNTGLTFPQQMKALEVLKYYELIKVQGDSDDMYFMIMEDERRFIIALEYGKGGDLQ